MRHRSKAALRIAIVAVASAVLLPAVIEAIYVTPTAVFMDERSQSAQVTIGNSGDTPEEATVELRFGFPDVDSAGTPYIRFVDDPGAAFPSATDWIRAFPQRVHLEPRSQQIVRLLARPPASLPDGEYWTRMIVTGSGAPLRAAGADSVVRAGVSLVIRLVTSVTYRKGSVSTGVVLRNLSAEAEGDSLTVWAHMDRQGNAAYLGTSDIELVDAAGATVRRWSTGLAVYVPVRRRFSYALDSIAPGDYRVRFRLRAQRPDLPADRVLPASTVTDSVAVRIG
jgi:P pilus assembly chaperone PapD